MGPPLVSLDKRIADALVAKSPDLDDIVALLKELDDTRGAVQAEHTHCMARSLDPTVVDGDARDRAGRAGHMLKRLDIARPRLQAIHDELVAADRLAKWHAELEALKVERDRVADKFRVRYCEVGSELIGIFDQMAAVDAKVHDLNNRANNVGARPRMRTFEMAAHGLDSWDQSKSILEELRLPGFGLGSGTVPLAWPRPPRIGSWNTCSR
jgi:hypothetical protein